MIVINTQHVTLHHILNQYDISGISSSKKLSTEREKHVSGLYKYLKLQYKDTKLKEYKLQYFNNFGKWLFYAYLNCSKSKLVTSNYNVNDMWIQF